MARKSQKQEAASGDSKNCAVLAVRSPVLAGQALKGISGFPDRVSLTDLVEELKLVGNEIADGNMRRVEQMLATQSILLDTLCCNLLCKAEQSDRMGNMETYMRLALKAQGQARATAEALAMVKNPQPYIRQANIAAGHQQVNNTYTGMPSGTHAGDSESAPSKLLGVKDEQRLDIGAAAAAVTGHQDMAAMGAVNRANH